MSDVPHIITLQKSTEAVMVYVNELERRLETQTQANDWQARRMKDSCDTINRLSSEKERLQSRLDMLKSTYSTVSETEIELSNLRDANARQAKLLTDLRNGGADLIGASERVTLTELKERVYRAEAQVDQLRRKLSTIQKVVDDAAAD